LVGKHGLLLVSHDFSVVVVVVVGKHISGFNLPLKQQQLRM